MEEMPLVVFVALLRNVDIPAPNLKQRVGVNLTAFKLKKQDGDAISDPQNCLLHLNIQIHL